SSFAKPTEDHRTSGCRANQECDLQLVRSLIKTDSNLIVSGTHVATELDVEPEARVAATPITVEKVDDATAFAGLRPLWNELLRARAADNPFLTWEWQHTWWNHLRESSALRLIVVRSGDELIAIAPLRLATRRSLFSRLEFLGTGYAGSDYLDLIVRRGR